MASAQVLCAMQNASAYAKRTTRVVPERMHIFETNHMLSFINRRTGTLDHFNSSFRSSVPKTTCGD